MFLTCVHHALLSQLYYLFCVVTTLSVIFMLAVNTFSQVFAPPDLAVTLNGVRWCCGMQKISHLRQNWLLIAREVFLVNHVSCGKD